MNRAMSLLAATGLGAGMMYFLDPNKGRRRRALVRDRMMRFSHELEDARQTLIRDARNRLHGLACGDLSVLVGGKNALRGNPLRGSWSPTGRAMLTMIGGGLFLRGLMGQAPTACIMGTAGLALMIEGITNAGVEDVRCTTSKAIEKVSQISSILSDGSDHSSRRTDRRQRIAQPADSRN